MLMLLCFNMVVNLKKQKLFVMFFWDVYQGYGSSYKHICLFMYFSGDNWSWRSITHPDYWRGEKERVFFSITLVFHCDPSRGVFQGIFQPA